MILTYSPVVLIPAFSPNEKLLHLVEALFLLYNPNIIVVDDGSDKTSMPIFAKLDGLPYCTVLHHSTNMGKGNALKTGMKYFEENFPNAAGVVTADCDGQHTAADIFIINNLLIGNSDDLILGVRSFVGKNIPLRSRLGNLLTIKLFYLLTGLNVTDTQSGLRGIPRKHIDLFCSIRGQRYEYEMNMLLECKQHGISIRCTKIDTIYAEQNQGSHFNPLLDSIKIYLVLFRFVSSSLISFAVDYGSFILFLIISHSHSSFVVLIAGIVSRIISSTVNFKINRSVVFKNNNKISATRYYILFVILMLVSSISVAGLHELFGGGAAIFKIIVDSLLFFGSFTVQREWVFKGNGNVTNNPSLNRKP